MANNKPSAQTQQEALAIAKGTQRPGQTKEQTKLIAQGIEKGISEYKKREKQKARERDKQRKKELSQKETAEQPAEYNGENTQNSNGRAALPWVLLAASWLAFITFYLFNAGVRA
ncbi:DUF2956 domain-containing protein [Reinekea marinisedimentorum]|uniref:DUF2956 family protein n=1 Tax=Reinekea marinisedimentorum TaxID=230495 RepID=A0A4R3IDT9_9GAMM|nr:DUF2956 domain-containing protein [Reinekea marinisedimentorum]TCS44034.1 Protein of unknown function (DUF2956) [Reinekea marinisedimentorum]